jgi:hypothetical protein
MKRPSHHRRSVPRGPTKYKEAFSLEVEDDKAVVHSWGCRKDRTDRDVLQRRHHAEKAAVTAVVDEVVAVPTGTSARTQLHKPGPDVTRGTMDRYGMRERSERRAIGKRATLREPPRLLHKINASFRLLSYRGAIAGRTSAAYQIPHDLVQVLFPERLEE